MKTADFDYTLPPALIAQTPLEPRDSSRLLVMHRQTGVLEHKRFTDVADYLRAGDVLVFNDSRVIPARLHGRKADGGGRVELLLLRRVEEGVWEALAKPGKRLKEGSMIDITKDAAEDGGGSLRAEVVGVKDEGVRLVRFAEESRLPAVGEIALPPYIHVPLEQPERYQTVYSRVAGSVAAPTAGLHFTPRLLDNLNEKGVRRAFVTLHVGLDTFRPVREEDPAQHRIHQEYAVLSPETAAELS
ncbi:MAG: S-adenosylmethionine:tRNA ribosyltransferase-isomerase, partial [Chloroflexota bacterium]